MLTQLKYFIKIIQLLTNQFRADNKETNQGFNSFTINVAQSDKK